MHLNYLNSGVTKNDEKKVIPTIRHNKHTAYYAYQRAGELVSWAKS